MHTFLTTQGHGGPPRMSDPAQCLGPPPRQHKHERQYIQSTHSVIPTRRIWNDDHDGLMIFRDLRCLKFPDMCLTGEEKPRKNLTQETCPRPGVELGPAAWQARMLPLAPQRWTKLSYLPTLLTQLLELSTFVVHTFLAPLHKIFHNSL